MSVTKKTTRKPKFGAPVESIPEATPSGARPAAYWVETAEYVKANPGVWHPVRFDHLTPRGHASAVQRINAATRGVASKTSKNHAFDAPGYEAAYRDGVMYIRYDQPAEAKVRKIGRSA
jgi:hypothetical protein